MSCKRTELGCPGLWIEKQYSNQDLWAFGGGGVGVRKKRKTLKLSVEDAKQGSGSINYEWDIFERWRLNLNNDGGGKHSLNPLTTPNKKKKQKKTPFPLRARFGSSTKAFVQSTVLFLFTLHLSSELSIRHSGAGWSKTEPHTHDRRIEP